jgi:hypothetical protein
MDKDEVVGASGARYRKLQPYNGCGIGPLFPWHPIFRFGAPGSLIYPSLMVGLAGLGSMLA